MEVRTQLLCRDLLQTEQHLTELLNRMANVCDSNELREVVDRQLSEHRQMVTAVFRFMHQKAWIRTQQADQGEVTQLYDRFREMQEQFEQWPEIGRVSDPQRSAYQPQP
ncbi:MAG: spore coat protein [Firmicutes bacterium]|nr:spore coat protein [Bacillota bacterium]